LELISDFNYHNINLTRHTYLNTKSYALIISFLSVFDMLNAALWIRIWREVRNFAWHRWCGLQRCCKTFCFVWF